MSKREKSQPQPDPDRKELLEAGAEGERGKISIEETPESVSFLGVTLEKAEIADSPFVPRREQYGDYIEDEYFLELLRKIATAFKMGSPILIEGGTSIGKTTAVKIMAALLGYEIHYVNLHGATDVEDLMGRYVPNPDKKGPNDPEFVFAEGKVTSGLRQEEGKRKIILLDEFNSSAPNIIVRLHEVLDALERNGTIVLSEDASESVEVDRTRTMVIALMNPPGKGYLGKEPLDPAQLRRWVYLKEPSNLPDSSMQYFIEATFGLRDSSSKTGFGLEKTHSLDQPLTTREVSEIPGIEELVSKYLEFHKAAKKLVAERKLAADQPQRFTFDDRMEPRRVMAYIATFYEGEINRTMQDALTYFYINKLESPEDRESLREALVKVEVDFSQTKTRRIDLGDQEQKGVNERMKASARKFLGIETPKDISSYALGLVGIDDEWAWVLREKIKDSDYGLYLLSLAGLDSDKVWEERRKTNEEITETKGKGYCIPALLGSITGLDSDKAWDLRENYKRHYAVEVLKSIRGLDSDRAWEVRDLFWNIASGDDKKRPLSKQAIEKVIIALAMSLWGVSGERAEIMRTKIAGLPKEKGFNFYSGYAYNLLGVNWPDMWNEIDEIMERMKTAGRVNVVGVLNALIGNESDRAWEIRDKIFEDSEGKYDEVIATSLADLDSELAWEMREKLGDRGVNSGKIFEGIYGGIDALIWRTASF